MTDEDRTQIQRALDNHEALKPSYFWTNQGNASSRRYQEKQLNFTVKFNHDGDAYQYDSVVRISTKNFYYTGRFTKNGAKKDVRLFKKLTIE